ncbi:MAG: hypothetical protein JWP88_1405 [Flaviaesturariibacter sp.]|nr:hypothetical protein [Flaviaesturariibacter sp.]
MNWTKVSGRKIRKGVFVGGLLAFLAMGSAQAQIPVQDSMVWIASTKYEDPAPLRWLLLGGNYRKEWETPVKLPVFHMTQMGLTIKELGGGQQTISLQLTDSKGRGWSLRSVDKEVSKAIPPSLRNTPVQGLVQDLVSGAHPYIPLIIPTLSKAAGVIAPVPTIYFVPDDPAFGEYRSLFANTLCLLEEREPTPDHSSTKNTEKVLDKLFEKWGNRIDQQAVLKARLLDMYIGDWDRHSDQWRWGTKSSANGDLYYPIPRDRDQAFFYSDGLLVKFIQLIAMRHLVSFDDDLSKIKSLNYKMWPFDGLFMNELDRGSWEKALKELEAAFTDDVIHQAMLHLPAEIYALRGERLEKKLRERRSELVRQGLRYYHLIAGRVKVYGTNMPDFFQVSPSDSGIRLTVYDYASGKKGRKVYERLLDAEDTFAIELYGLKGADHFVVDEGVNTKIKLFFNGEDGADVYDIRGGSKNTIIDAASENNTILNKSATKLQLH